MINSITLPNGKVYKIPIFDAWTTNGLDIKSRGNAALLSVSDLGAITWYQGLTMEDVIYIARILTGEIVNDFGTLPRPSNGERVATCYWYYDSNTDSYLLAHPFAVSNGVIDWNQNPARIYGGQDDAYFFNNTNVNNTHDTNFYGFINWMHENWSPGFAARRTANFRQGYIATLDIARDMDAQEVSGPFNVSEDVILENIAQYAINYPDEPIDYTEQGDDYTDPYGNIISSGAGGGDGQLEDPDKIEKATIPALPSISAVDAGMITMYYATSTQINALAAFLWSNAYDLDANFTKLFASPMDCIIGLSLVPVMPNLSGGVNVKFGNITTNVSMTKLSSQYTELDCGSVTIPKFIGCFMDYSPYVKLSLYLPYIGFRELDPNDVVGESIHVVYHIDCLTGGCTAFIECSKKGLLYSYNGSCIANIPVTAINYSGAIQNAVSMVSTAGSMGVNAATGNLAGLAGNLSSAANSIFNMKPSIERSGNMGGAPGIMAYQKPMLVIERPRMSVPNNLNHFRGNTLYVTRKLSACKGFNQIEMINLEGIPCTREEKNELDNILREGVYF